MKCKDCKYYKPINDTEGKCNSPVDAYYGFDTTVVGGLGKCDYFKPYPPYVIPDRASGGVIDIAITADDDICPDFVPIEDAWDSVSK